ncbi:MAG: hypothetical protein SGJ18_04670 [Pseudomonadota bacterium]|nr:hypothetical protein [Pseudomonadota bacterium]
MKKLIIGIFVTVFFSNFAQALETHYFRSSLQIFVCPPDTPADECEDFPYPRVPLDYSIELKDIGGSDPHMYSGNWSQHAERGGKPYSMDVTLAKAVYTSAVWYQVKILITDINEARVHKLVIEIPDSMENFNEKINIDFDPYKKGEDLHTPVFTFLRYKSGLSLLDQFRIPILADIIASE